MPYLTPDDLPEGDTCRPLFIPAGSDWLAIVSGALTELVKPYNWQQEGSVTVSEAVARMTIMVNQYYAGLCCSLPDGDPIMRINPETYAIEQLVNGEWVEPQGDYTIPPTPARTEPTAYERRCLAAANAVNALAVLYESLTDSFAEGQSQSLAAAAFAETLVTIIGTIFGIVVAPILTLFAVIFAEVYATVEFLTSDLWTEDFTEKLTCYFYECSEDDGDVIHFDMPCIVGKIAETTDIDWTFDEVRLLLQVGGIMNLLGSQAIDAAGATTAIAEADCGVCAVCETYDDDMIEGIGAKTRIVQIDPADQTFWIYPTGSPDGEWTDVPLVGVDGRVVGTTGSPHGTYVAAVLIDLGTECLIDDWSFDYFRWGGSATCDLYVQWGAYDDAGAYITGGGECRGGGSFGWYPEYYLGFNTVARYLYFKVYAGAAGDSVSITNIHVQIT